MQIVYNLCVGKAIVYCGDCGRSLRDDDFEHRRAGHLDGRPFCAECRPQPAPEDPRPLSGSSARLRALVEHPPTARSSSSTRRAVSASAPGASARGLWLGLGGAAALLAIVIVASSSSRPSPPPAEPPPPPRAAAGTAPPRPATQADAVSVEAQMLAQKAVDDAARLDRFVADIRSMLRDLPEMPSKRDEIARMIDTLPPGRRGEADRLHAELDARIRDGRLDGLLRSLRDALASPSSLLERGNEIRAWIAEADPLAGGRRAEFDALRANALAKLGDAEKSFRLAIDFEGDFKKKLQRIDDWGGLRYGVTPDLVHEGAGSLHLASGDSGAGFWMRGIHEERTYRMSAWARRLTEGEAYLGFEFFPEDDGRLTKDVARIDSTAWKRYEFTVKAPAGARRVLFWAWNDKAKKGAYLVDDVEIVLLP